MRLTNAEDHIFKEVRNISRNALGSVTSRKIREIEDLLGQKGANMSIKEMTNYMADVKRMNIAKTKQLIDIHVNIATEIKQKQQNIDYQ